MADTFTYRILGDWGAFGNQLWQIFGTMGLAKREGKKVVFPSWYYQKFFSFPEQLFGGAIPDDAQDFSENYLQDLRYFELLDEEFNYLTPSSLVTSHPSYQEHHDCKATVIHVRRGDYLGLPDHHPVQTADYYKRAFDLLQPESLCVFSDDLDWCREQEVFSGAKFGLGNPGMNPIDLTKYKPIPADTTALDFCAMRCHDSFVISNSTFSLWAAMQSDRVVYPLNWYGPQVSADYTLMIKEHWVGI